MNYNLEGLTKEEGHNYITEKLKGAGCNQSMLIGDSNKASLGIVNIGLHFFLKNIRLYATACNES